MSVSSSAASVVMLPEGQPGIDARLGRGQALLFKAPGLGASEWLVVDLAVRTAAPECFGFAQQPAGLPRAPARQFPAPLGNQVFELEDVGRVGRYVERVSRR